MVGIEQ